MKTVFLVVTPREETVSSSLLHPPYYSIFGRDILSILKEEWGVDRVQTFKTEDEYESYAWERLEPGEHLVFVRDAYIPRGISFDDVKEKKALLTEGFLWSYALNSGERPPRWRQWVQPFLFEEREPLLYLDVKDAFQIVGWDREYDKNLSLLTSFFFQQYQIHSLDLKALYPFHSEDQVASGLVQYVKSGNWPFVVSPALSQLGEIYVDCTLGPVVIDKNCTLRGVNLLRGPLYLGKGSILQNATLSRVFTGRQACLSGEISNTVLGDFVNKAHEGYIGHSFVGSWVNIAAGTITADLKNTYTPATYYHVCGKKDRATTLKMGSFISSFVTVGVRTLLHPGSCVGACVNLCGGELVDRYIPPFIFYHTPQHQESYLYDKAVKTFQIMKSRRQQGWSERDHLYLQRNFSEYSKQRESFLD